MATKTVLFYVLCTVQFTLITSVFYRTGPLPENCQWSDVRGTSVLCKDSLPDFASYDPVQLSKISHLQVTDCDQTILSKDSFSGLSNLRILVLDCKLLGIEPGAFSKLDKLMLLSLAEDALFLPDGLFCDLPTLSSLLLTKNYLASNTSLGFHSQCVLDTASCGVNITYLSIDQNDITEIRDVLLCNLPNLEIFNASNNRINLISPMAFSKSIHLRKLYLGSNSISTLDPSTFLDTLNLTLLDLSYNKLTVIPSTLFKNLNKLNNLNLRGNKLEMINRIAFSNLSSLNSLDLSYNALSKLDGSLNSLTKLNSLYLNGNKLKEISAITFSFLIHLNNLNLDDNSITSIDKSAFKFTPTLALLSINNNRLKVLPNFGNLNMLFSLFVANNSITKLSETAFQNNSHIMFIDVHTNKLETINNQTFANLTSLLKLDLSENQIKTIDNGSFNDLDKLKFLYLQNNQLTFQENLDDDMENNHLFLPLTSVLLMNLSSNAISQFSYSWFPYYMIYLSLSNNSIKTLPFYNKLVDPTPHMHSLDLSFNNIVNITASQFPPSLINIILSKNKIESIDKYAFRDMSNLEYLFLRSNALTTLPALDMGSALTTVTLRDNPWLCDCKQTWLQNMKELPFMVYDSIAMSCSLMFNKTHSEPIALFATTGEDFLCSFKQDLITDSDNKTKCTSSSSLKSCLYHCPNNCTCYHDLTWKIVKIDCSSANLHKVPEAFPKITKVYYLDGNSIDSISSKDLQNATSLRELYLNSSKIITIENGTFSMALDLEVLHLDHNLLETLPNTVFQKQDKLIHLDLSFNRLGALNEGTFLPMKSLQTLNLQSNQLTNFPVWALSDTPSITALSLYDNPWNCDCTYALKYREWLQNHIEKMRNISLLQCSMDTANGPVKVSLTIFNSTHCSHPLISAASSTNDGNHSAVVAVSVCVSIVALVIGILAFIYRQELRLSIQRRFGVRLL